MENVKKALVCDWLDVYSGAERCIEQFNKLYDFDIFALVDFMSADDRELVLGGKKVSTTFIQKLPFAKRFFRHYLPLFSRAIESIDLRGYELVLSSSHCVAKNILTDATQLHISYMYSPTRYAWDMKELYLEGQNALLRPFIAELLYRFRIWDGSCANRSDKIIAISHFIASRIKKIYGRDAAVIYPPVNTGDFRLQEKKDDYFITCGRLVGYKRTDLLVRAFNESGLKLVVVGDGEQMSELKAIAKPNVELLGKVSKDELVKLLGSARGFVYAGVEDFGIAALEAMSCGTPVIAYDKGGVAESVKGSQKGGFGSSGVLFSAQNESSLNAAIKASFELDYDPAKLSAYAKTFSNENFRKNINEYLKKEYEIFKETH